MKIGSFKFLGVKINPLNYKLVLKRINELVISGKSGYICVAAVHLIMECQRDKDLREGVNNASLVTTDGMPLVWILRAAGYREARRVYGPDLMLKLCELTGGNGYKIFLLGGAKGQSRLLACKLKKMFPMIKIVGSCDTPIRPISVNENKKIINIINKSGAQIVFVGMGCPYQEQWMISNQASIKTAVTIGVGAAFDFITGKVRQAPKWVQNIGFEWLFRLCQNPRRLWYRYTILNIYFLFMLAREKYGSSLYK